MKIISWNCQGAFRNKAEIIQRDKPDILVVQECEHPPKLLFSSTTVKPTDSLWFGDNQSKGLGIFSYGKYKFKLHEQYNSDFKTIVPISITEGQFDFTLYAICANNPQDKTNQYVGQVWKAINYYDNLLGAVDSILIGDFNSNTIWDKKNRIGNHTDVVKFLESKDIHSLYHRHFSEQQGKETQPTFYLYRHEDKPYHIDYCFVSNSLLRSMNGFKIGRYEEWKMYSDHMPLEVSFNNE
jgi:exodeoxyribonuclease-3